MARVLRMPDVASDEDDGVLAAWLIEESSTFDAAQTIAYVETESMLLSVEAGRPGVLVKALVEPGEVVDPGTPIGVLADPEERVDDLDALLERLGIPADTRAPAPELTLVSHPLGGQETLGPVGGPVGGPEPLPESESESLRGSLPEALAGGVEEDEHPAPHLVLRSTARAEALRQLHADVAGGTTSATLLDLVVKLVAATCQLVPELAAETGREFVDVALAVPGPSGDVVAPVVRDPASLSLGRLAATTRDLLARAADGRLDPTELAGGTIEVTDLAPYGLAEMVAAVTPPHLAHLVVGTVRDEPVVDDGELVPGQVVTVTLSVDHVRVDRLVAARWLATFVDLVGRPARALV